MEMSPAITDRLTGLLPEQGTILDLGCGDGSLLRSLSGKGYPLLGVDPALQTGDAHRQAEDITLLSGTAESIPLPQESVDIVIMQCVFSLCQPKETVAEILRVLKEGGMLLLSDLFSDVSFGQTQTSPLLGAIYRRGQLEAFFLPFFQKKAFFDETPALTQMLLQAMMVGESEQCVSCRDLALLRRIRARYGIWVWEKHKDHPID